jgi:hypothetical protein
MTAAMAAHAADSSSGECPAKTFRFAEDCRGLRGQDLTGVETLRYLPLDAKGAWWVQFGGQYRYRLEHLDEPNYGIGGIPGYTAHGHRLFADGMLQSSGGVMVFVELGVAIEHGREPIERPFDHSALDLTQGFIQVPIPLASWRGSLRLGRQELDSGGNRLLSAREASNLRRTFDMALASVANSNHEVQLFAGRPVVNFPGAFDDHRSPTEKVVGGLGTWRPLGLAVPSTVGIFFIDRSLDRQLGPITFLPERRRTLGLRTSVRGDTWDGELQAAWQWGEQAERNIRAYGIAGGFGHAWPEVPGAPRAGVSMGWASGDSAPARGAVGTFDVIYPSLDYFTDAPLSYPGNTFDIRPTLRGSPLDVLTLQAGTDWIFRIDRADSVFAPPGFVLVPGGHGGSGRIATLADIRATWHILRRWDVLASAVRGLPGRVLDSAHAHDALFLLFQATGKF